MKRARHDRRFWVALMVAAAIALCALGTWRIHQRQAVLRLGYKLSAATATLQKARAKNRRLRLERSVLTNPARIERLAESLGLVQPAPGNVRVIHEPAIAPPDQTKEREP